MSTPSIRQLGRYELLRRVAAGGMGEIFLARMRGAAGFEKRVIIKTILPHLAEEEEFIEKFLDEGRIVVQLTHGNIVPVFDMGEEHGEFFIAMEYIPGRDLRDLIKTKHVSGETVDLPIAMHIIAEVCKGLGYAHRKRDEEGDLLELVHRDVSPSNVLISSEGEVKLIDFGIARATTKISRTVSGRIQGKFNYMSPEQASGKLVDARSDIFSTGVMLYELLTGKRPFDGVTDLETIDLVRTCEFDSASTLNSLIPEEVDAIIERAICRDLDARYQTIDRMQADILGYLYREECAPSSRDVVSYLARTFSGEIERNELRSGTPSHTSLAPRQTGPKRLDDILGAELDRLGEGGTADPFTRTDASLPSSPAPSHHTATLITDLAPSTPRMIEDAARIVTPTTAKDTAQPVEEQSHSPLHEDDSLDASARDEPPRAQESAGAVTPVVEDEEAKVIVEVAPAAPDRKPLLIVAGVLIALLIGGAFWNAQYNTPGTLKIATDPPGAQLTLDGAIVLDALTPLQLDVKPGWHDVNLHRQGFEPYNVRLKMNAGQVIALEGGRLTLSPIPDPDDGPLTRTITIATRPPGATLLVDGREIGPSPQDIEIEQGTRVIVYAKKEGCEDADVTLSHRYANPAYTISMLCREDRLPEVITNPTPQEPDKVKPTKPREIAVMIRVQPADAIITINDRDSREGVYTGRMTANKKLKITAFKKGYATFDRTTTAADLKNGTLQITLKEEPKKCINIRLMQIQMADDVQIDGSSIGPVKSSKRGIEVSPGPHTVRAINKVAGRDETTTITVPSDASDCVNAVLFSRD